MKKLLVSALSVTILCTVNVYASKTCALANETRAPVDPQAYNDASLALDNAKVSLCGANNYDKVAGKCLATTPATHIGGIWGTFKEVCFSDNIKGSCLYKKQVGNLKKDAAYCFISEKGGFTTPPEARYCAKDSIKCPISKRDNGDHFENKWLNGRLNKKGSGGCGGNWVNCCVKASKVDRHSKDSWWFSGQSSVLTDDQKDELDTVQAFDEQDTSVADACVSLCSTYWTTLAAIKTNQTTFDNMCVSSDACTPGDPSCDCAGTQQGFWDSAVNKCICTGQQGTANFDNCVCVNKTPAGVWSGGMCYPTGTVTVSGYDNNGTGNGNGNGSGAKVSSTTPSDNATTSSTGSSGSGGAVISDTSAAKESAAGAASTGQSWLNQLKNSLGVTTTSGGQKFNGSGGDTQLTGLGGLGNSGEKKKVPTQGIAPQSEDVFAAITASYVHNQSSLMGPEADTSPDQGSSKSPAKPISTSPVIYK